MVWIDTDTVCLQIECVLAKLQILQLIFVQIWPPPDLGVNNMGESLPGLHLQSAIESPRNGDTFGRLGPAGGDCRYQGVQLVPLLLQLFHEALDCALRERLGLASLQYYTSVQLLPKLRVVQNMKLK